MIDLSINIYLDLFKLTCHMALTHDMTYVCRSCGPAAQTYHSTLRMIFMSYVLFCAAVLDDTKALVGSNWRQGRNFVSDCEIKS